MSRSTMSEGAKSSWRGQRGKSLSSSGILRGGRHEPGELEALRAMIGVVLGWSDSVRATVADHWSRTPSPTTTHQVVAAGRVHCAGSRKRCQTVDKAVRRGTLPETVGR